MNSIVIVSIICVTLVALAMIGDASKDKMIREQQHLLWRYKAMVDALLAAVHDGELGEQEAPPEIDGGE